MQDVRVVLKRNNLSLGKPWFISYRIKILYNLCYLQNTGAKNVRCSFISLLECIGHNDLILFWSQMLDYLMLIKSHRLEEK